MATIEPIRVDGLKKFSKDLKTLDNELPKALRVALNQAAGVITSHAVPRVPRGPTGRAKKSLKERSTRTTVRVAGGSKRVPYYPWLDFGGRVGRNNSIRRPFRKEGRYIYKAYFDAKQTGEFGTILERALLDVARQAGVEVE